MPLSIHGHDHHWAFPHSAKAAASLTAHSNSSLTSDSWVLVFWALLSEDATITATLHICCCFHSGFDLISKVHFLSKTLISDALLLRPAWNSTVTEKHLTASTFDKTENINNFVKLSNKKPYCILVKYVWYIFQWDPFYSDGMWVYKLAPRFKNNT